MGKTLALSLTFALLNGCANHSAFIVSGSSVNSPDEAVALTQAAIERAQGSGCRAVSVSNATGVGVGIAVKPGASFVGDDEGDKNGENIVKGRMIMHAVTALVQCPMNVRLGPDGSALPAATPAAAE